MASSVVPSVTGIPPLVSVPAVIAITLKLIGSACASASSAAAARAVYVIVKGVSSSAPVRGATKVSVGRRNSFEPTLTFTVTAGSSDRAKPSQTLIVNASTAPVVSAGGLQTRESPVENNVVPGTTGAPPLVNAPAETASILKWMSAPVGTASLAAARRVA